MLLPFFPFSHICLMLFFSVTSSSKSNCLSRRKNNVACTLTRSIGCTYGRNLVVGEHLSWNGLTVRSRSLQQKSSRGPFI
ncbi:hypothetical protein DFS33DRAFT_1368828 [Desarmillaria ectypa]|nr:hypothetical protein DFS33DRAFT_1368828 [Desarmillaria ectypa]